MELGEKINTNERIIIEASNVTRYLGYPRKVPIWRINFKLPLYCYVSRNKDNSDISLEIEDMRGFAVIPSLSKEEALKRLKTIITEFKVEGNVLRI
jgi:hypothetical protein|tara:strand:- start:634 stop:921 length:288 start_codon:yes stop_codon:yes gene_type:complete